METPDGNEKLLYCTLKKEKRKEKKECNLQMQLQNKWQIINSIQPHNAYAS